MNIQQASTRELKSYIESLMFRYTAVSGHFASVNPETRGRIEPLSSYVRDVAELVEMSRLAQSALARLIEIDGRNVERFYTDKTLYDLYPQLDNLQDIHPGELRGCFMELMHMSGGHANSVAETFSSNVSKGDDEDTDYSQIYASCRYELADIHGMSLKAQVALTHLLQLNNRERFRNGL